MRRLLIIAGIVLLAMGLLWPWLARSNWWRWIGRLPGDIRIEREGFSFFLPITTAILFSLLLSLLLWVLRR